MSSYFVACYIVSLILAVITLITGIYVGIKRLNTVKILPRALRLFLVTCCFPFFFSTKICSIHIAVFYLSYHTQTHLTIEIARTIVSFSSQQIRNAFTLIVIERIIATVKLERYVQASKLKLLWKLTFISYIISAFYIGFTIYVKLAPEYPYLYNIANCFIYCTHVFMISVCAILYFMNRRMYKISAFRITLKRRYSIAQNVKILSYLFPSIFIYSVFAQFGSMINIIFQALSLPSPPIAAFHLFFNSAFLLIYLRHFLIDSRKLTRIHSVTFVRNPLGKNIPTMLTNDQYFHGLRHQWK